MFALSYLSTRRLQESEFFWVEHGYQIIASLKRHTPRKDAESGQRTYLFTSDERTLGSLNTAANKFRAQLDHLDTLTADNPSQHARLERLEALNRADQYPLVSRPAEAGARRRGGEARSYSGVGQAGDG